MPKHEPYAVDPSEAVSLIIARTQTVHVSFNGTDMQFHSIFGRHKQVRFLSMKLAQKGLVVGANPNPDL